MISVFFLGCKFGDAMSQTAQAYLPACYDFDAASGASAGRPRPRPPARALRLSSRLLRLSTLLGTLVSLLAFTFTTRLPTVFTRDPAVLAAMSGCAPARANTRQLDGAACLRPVGGARRATLSAPLCVCVCAFACVRVRVCVCACACACACALAQLLLLALLLHATCMCSEGLLLGARQLTFLASRYGAFVAIFLSSLYMIAQRGLGLGAVWRALAAFQAVRLSAFAWRLRSDGLAFVPPPAEAAACDGEQGDEAAAS
jgi:hypothetical protein